MISGKFLLRKLHNMLLAREQRSVSGGSGCVLVVPSITGRGQEVQEHNLDILFGACNAVYYSMFCLPEATSGWILLQ